MSKYLVYSNPRKRTTRKRATTTRKRAPARKATTTRKRAPARRRTYATRRNPVSRAKKNIFIDIGKQAAVGAAGTIAIGFVGAKIAKQLKKDKSPVQGLILVGLSAAAMYAGQKTKQPLLTSAGLSAAGFGGLYLADKLLEGKDDKSPLDNVLAGDPDIVREYQDDDDYSSLLLEEPATESGVFSGYQNTSPEPAGINNGVFS